MRKKLIWLLPSFIMLMGIALLFYENYQEVTEPPKQNWSREIELASTPSTADPVVQKKESGMDISYLDENGVTKLSLDESFTIENEHTYQIPYDKWTQFYQDEENLIYSDYYGLYDGETDEKISDITRFFPLQKQIIYQEELEVMLLDPDTHEPTPLITLDEKETKLSVVEDNDSIYMLTYYNGGGNNQLTFYDITSDGAEELGTSEFTVRNSEVVEDINFSIQEDQYSLLLTTNQKQTMSGSPVNFYYFAQESMNENPELELLELHDPNSKGNLTDISDIEFSSADDQTQITFKALGSTETMYRNERQFNIFEASISEDEAANVSRLSNTPDSSGHPYWIDSETILWFDLKGDANRMLLASSDEQVIKQSNQMTMNYFLNTLGKTLGMLSYSFFTLLVGVIWFIWPMLFLAFIMFGPGNAIDHDKPWIFFSGAGIYLAAAFIFNDRVFTSTLMARAPDYLSFLASPFVFISIFALITYAIIALSAKKLDWSVSIRLSYFIGIHLLFITIFFGPYLL
ncbi:hypothetical protein LF817_15805 [Halobacillus sp. A1]|uniref:hypothetical protein n=1 Tax=Halobacillus sp. A1 TaxID=2880262 RepID=UPI0020A68039|nr:hypothetical protein [Halobacillus sp. A1]MCP3032790.1 hypothetical protein [Halobacillus sp. A1]